MTAEIMEFIGKNRQKRQYGATSRRCCKPQVLSQLREFLRRTDKG